MQKPILLILFAPLFLLGIGTLYAEEKRVPPKNAEARLHFERHVRPLVVAHCFSCHGENVQEGGLRLNSREALFKGGRHGSVVSLQKPKESLLLQAVHQSGNLKMPPSGKLRPDEISALEVWVQQGALWSQVQGKSAFGQVNRANLWSLRPIKSPALPKVHSSAWAKTPIDAFILHNLEAAKVSPPVATDRRTLLRRVTYDLIGLPPTPQEVTAFLQDKSPRAYEKVVERLLQSPHYGERWGRHWLDVVRYADTAGENTDHPLPHAWRYRNWVIDAFNSNKPYDVFLKEQIAGDLMARQGTSEQYASRVVATGYLAIARRFGHDIDQDMHLTYEDTIDTLG